MVEENDPLSRSAPRLSFVYGNERGRGEHSSDGTFVRQDGGVAKKGSGQVDSVSLSSQNVHGGIGRTRLGRFEVPFGQIERLGTHRARVQTSLVELNPELVGSPGGNAHAYTGYGWTVECAVRGTIGTGT